MGCQIPPFWGNAQPSDQDVPPTNLVNDLEVNPPTHRSALFHVESLPSQHSSRMPRADLLDPSSDLVSDGPHRLGLQDLNSFGPPSLSP